MCDICRDIYRSDTKHGIAACPLRSALFCNVCQTYGHSTFKCPDKATWRVRTPEYIEQLIPPTLLRHHNITSLTPMPHVNPLPMECQYTPVLEVPIDKTGQYIRATLACHNLPCSSIKENKTVLEAYGALIGKKVVYVQNSANDVMEKADKKIQRAAARAKDEEILQVPVRKVIRTKKNVASAPTSAPTSVPTSV